MEQPLDIRPIDIRDIVRMTGLTSRALRFYEARGLVTPLRTYLGRHLRITPVMPAKAGISRRAGRWEETPAFAAVTGREVLSISQLCLRATAPPR